MSVRSEVSGWAAKRMAGWLAGYMKRAYETGTGSDIIKIITEAWGGGKTAAGVSINEDKALTIGAVYTAIRIISSTLASLPLHVMRRTENRREFAIRHWAYALLHDSPNEYHTSFTWRETLIAHLLLWGNHYSRIEWLQNGAAGALYPLMPWQVRAYRRDSGEQYYEVKLPDGTEDLPADEVLHIPGLGYDGLKGVSVIQYQRDMLGTSKAMELFTGSFFKNGARPGAILETPGRMNEEAQKKLASSLMEKFGQVSDSFKVLVLEEGSKLHTYTMPLQDAQLLESRKLSRSEVFGLYGVPPHLGGDTERSTSWGTGIEQQDIGYAKHTITPLCVRIEQEINRKLFGRGSALFCKFNLEGLMRGDYKSRMEGHRIAVGGPFLSRAEARDIEDWNASDEAGMELVLTPLNMGVGATPPLPDKPAAPDPAPADQTNSAPVITINNTPPALQITASVAVPDNVRHEVTHQHPDIKDLARAQREATRQMTAIADRAHAATTEQALQMQLGLKDVVSEVRKPRKPKYDAEGNIVASMPIDAPD